MSENLPHTSDAGEQNFDDIGILVGMEFNDCSIPAAEAHKLAIDTANFYRSNPTTLYRVDDDSLQPAEYYIANLNYKFEIDNKDFDLILVSEKTQKTFKDTRGRFIKRTVELAYEDVEYPVLAVRMGKDTFLPLASFGEESSIDQCNYLQIGSEVTDDSLVMTPLDDQTPRLAVVEAIRDILKALGHSRKPVGYAEKAALLSPLVGSIDIIQSLLAAQLVANRESLASSREAELTRRAAEQLHKAPEREFRMLYGQGHTYELKTRAKKLLTNVTVSDGRKMNLEVAETDEGATIVATTRGNIAVPVASLYNDTGSVLLHNDQLDCDPVAKARVVEKLLYCLGNKVLDTPKWETPPWYSPVANGKSENFHLTGVNRVIATFFYERGLFKASEGAIPGGRYGLETITDREVNSLYRRLQTFMDDPEHAKPPYSSEKEYRSKAVDLALQRLPVKIAAERDFMQQLGVDGEFSEQLPLESPQAEYIAEKLHSLATGGKRFTGILHDVDTGKVRSDIELFATIDTDETEHYLTVAARPSSRTNVEPRTIMTHEFDSLGSIANGKNTDQLERIIKILKVLRAS